MKQGVYYLYEYQGNQQIRNIGFVKCHHKEERATFQIHGKGLNCNKLEQYEMNLFSEKDEVCYISRAGHVETEQGKINYIVTVNEVEESVFEDYDGLYIQVDEDKRYVAMWTQKKVPFHQIESYANVVENAMDTEVFEAEEVSDFQQKCDIIEAECVEDQNQEIEAEDLHDTEMLEPEEMVEEALIEAEECCYDTIRRRKEQEVKESTHRDQELRREVVEKDYSRKEVNVRGYRETQITYEKIERQDIAKLPQREWRLANNSFLLHGYHNYQHILFIQEAGRSFIGVPGVYSARESDVAKSFGFPVFHRIEPGHVKWEEGECDLRADFGYWCKEVSYRVNR